MNTPEQVYARFVEANPVPDPNDLTERLEPDLPALRLVASDVQYVPTGVAKSRSTGRRLVVGSLVASVLVITVLGVAWLSRTTSGGVADVPDSGVAVVVPLSSVEQVQEFIERLGEGAVDGAVEMLSDSVGSVYFVSLGQATNEDQMLDYFEFAQAIGIETSISECSAVASGPRSLVICDALQTAGALELIGLELPPFQMTFEVWDDGIRSIGFVDESADFPGAFQSSRFVVFQGDVLAPAGLLQPSGDPIWSRESGEEIVRLIDEFLDQ